MLHTINQLLGYKLGATDGEIGSIKDFYFDDQHWTVRYLLADTGHWLPGRNVLLSPHAFDKLNAKERVLKVKLSKKQVEESPSIHADIPVSRQNEVDYFQHYGWPAYWQGPFLWGPSAFPIVGKVGFAPSEEEKKEVEHTEDAHLRSIAEVHGYHIQAQDGEIGHVADMLLDDQNWMIRYLVVDTRNWWPGKKVLVAPLWIDKVSWQQSKVFVDLRRDSIKEAPEFDPAKPVSREYETALFRHYSKPAYWE